MSELEIIDCPLCNSKRYRKEFTGKDYLFSQEEFTVVKCENCEVLFTNPRVREDKISRYYFSDYPAYKEIEESNSFKKIKHKIGGIFGNPHLEILKLLKSIKAKDVLEIGPGNGSLLFFLKEHNFEVIGVEKDRNCVEKIREKGIPCYLGDLNEVVSEIGFKKFDAIVLCHVFEHLYDPKKTLQKIYDLLNENGIIYIIIPNIGSLEAKIFGKYWRGLDLPRHTVHYDISSIRSTLVEKGFKIIKLENQIFPSSFLESIAFRFFKKGKLPKKLYYSLYYPWKLLSPIHTRIIGSGIVKVIVSKNETI
jgi:SAM-dependent methyltransferase